MWSCLHQSDRSSPAYSPTRIVSSGFTLHRHRRSSHLQMGGPRTRARSRQPSSKLSHVISNFLSLSMQPQKKKSVYGQCSSSWNMKRNESLNSLYATLISDFDNMRNPSQKASILQAFKGLSLILHSLSLNWEELSAATFRLYFSGRKGLFIHFFAAFFSSDGDTFWNNFQQSHWKAIFHFRSSACGLRLLTLIFQERGTKGPFHIH